MSAISLSTSVNQHYLNKIITLTDFMEVAASEDIIDTRGKKLASKGSRLTRSQQETLGMHRLAKPLESSLAAEDAVDTPRLISSATQLLDTCTALRRIMGTCGGSSALAMLGEMKFGHAMRMMLTLTDRSGPSELEHSLAVSLLSMCMAKRLRLSDSDQMAAGVAGLLHDIGELYIDPVYLVPGKRLLPHEWAHLVVHPRIGQMLINELESYPLTVGRAVAEHHERYDGTGYPRQCAGLNISGPGQAVSVAEMIAGVLHKDRPLERAELALKIIPGEHARDLLSAVSDALRAQGTEAAPEYAHEGTELCVEQLFWRISSTLEAGQGLADALTAAAPQTRDLLERTLHRIKTIQRAFISTGLDAYLKRDHGLYNGSSVEDGPIMFEKAVATREITWRLRDIARELALDVTTSPDQQLVFSGLIDLLDDAAANDAATLPQAAQACAA